MKSNLTIILKITKDSKKSTIKKIPKNELL